MKALAWAAFAAAVILGCSGRVERAGGGRLPVDAGRDPHPYMCVICQDGTSFTDVHCDIARCREHDGVDYCFDTRVEKSKRRHGAKFTCSNL